MRPVLLPARLDNTYRGQRLALWLFALVVAMRLMQSLTVLIGGASIVRSADGVPLDAFPAAAPTIVTLFALASLARLVLFAVCAVAWWRYRSAIPALFTLLALYTVAAQTLLVLRPLARIGTPPGPGVNAVLTGLTLVGCALAWWPRAVAGERAPITAHG